VALLMVRRRLEKMMGLVMVRESSGGARQRERTYEPGTAAADSQHSLPVSEASQSQSQSSDLTLQKDKGWRSLGTSAGTESHKGRKMGAESRGSRQARDLGRWPQDKQTNRYT
jgi:hypothetical protein